MIAFFFFSLPTCPVILTSRISIFIAFDTFFLFFVLSRVKEGLSNILFSWPNPYFPEPSMSFQKKKKLKKKEKTQNRSIVSFPPCKLFFSFLFFLTLASHAIFIITLPFPSPQPRPDSGKQTAGSGKWTVTARMKMTFYPFLFLFPFSPAPVASGSGSGSGLVEWAGLKPEEGVLVQVRLLSSLWRV